MLMIVQASINCNNPFSQSVCNYSALGVEIEARFKAKAKVVAGLGFKLRIFSRKKYVDLLSTPNLR